MLRFPDGFLWGAATSSYQIEGAGHEDGRGESIWDRFAARAGAIADGSDGSVACDHYHRWKEDIEIMKRLGLGAYRFSVAWPRVFPTGRWQYNPAGLAFYDRLVDGLLEAGIEPFVTLYHWDLPQPLEDAGGWAVRDTVNAFVEYADVVTDQLGDRVRRFITHNEPWCISVLGYAEGLHAPGRRDWPAALAAAHHVLLSHGLATAVIRENSPDAEVGITLNLVPAEAASSSPADREACRAFDGAFNRWFLDPIYGRGYPEDAIADHVAAGHLPSLELPFVHPGDLAIIAAPTDFLGVNYYSRAVLRSEVVAEADNAPRTVHLGDERTDIGWEVYPDGLRQLLMRVHRDYTPDAIYITENGAAYDTAPDEHGRIHDIERQRFLHAHLAASLEACRAGVPLAGYFVWSLLDNYEWQEGYRKRFGIVWVDFTTQERVLKQSASLYRAIVADNALPAIEPHPAHARRRVLQR
ncbi:MAG: beta-glucosidase [Myxococcales bacterium]|nr:beta-glucosidase [Myxococcales bacterium]